MISCAQTYQIRWDGTADRAFILEKAEGILSCPIRHITDIRAEKSPGSKHAYYSNGDYWWPDPTKTDGLPYIRRDGESNPDNFHAHREILREMRTHVAFLTEAYRLTAETRFAERACQILREFFLEEETRMEPHLNYAQAIPGICDGRGIGIIDTLHLIELPFAIEHLHDGGCMTDTLHRGLAAWFQEYLHWMWTSKNGIEERETENNHAVCYYVQAASFARFTDNAGILQSCREAYRTVLLSQMAPDGSFPRELARTKPYNYSLFVLDNMVTLCFLLSTEEENLWDFQGEEGKSIRRAIDFLKPYLIDKESWPYPRDIEHYDAFPQRLSVMIFAGTVLGDRELLTLYESLPQESLDPEARRNAAIRLGTGLLS